MRHFARVALLLALALSAVAAPNPAPVNLDFESGAPGEVPPGWRSTTTRLGYAVAIDAEGAKQGKQSVRVSGAPKAGEPMAFGNVMQTVDAASYRGKRVRIRGAVRVEGNAASAGLWFRVDRPEKQTGFFDNMQNRPIMSRQWAYYETTGDVANDAETLNFGLMLQREGSAWLDDVTIEIVPNRALRSAPPRALTPRGLENLIAFTRLYGIVRHFHASDEAAAANWDAVAVNGVELVEGAKDAAELASRLNDLFLPLAPSMRLFPSDAARQVSFAKPEEANAIMEWSHRGFGQKQPGSMYASERVRRDAPAELQPYRTDLGGGVSAIVPLAVYATASHTLPRPTRTPLAPSQAEYTGNDRSTRIGAVVILWNVMQHFYPYFDVIDADWPVELNKALSAAATDRDEAAFQLTLRRLVAALDDGHGSVTHPAGSGRVPLALRWRLIGDALVVTAVDPTLAEVKRGDEVIAIDGKPALQAIRDAESLISGAPQWQRVSAQYVVSAAATPQSALTIRNADGSTRTVTVTRKPPAGDVTDKRAEPLGELKPGIWYADLERITDTDFNAALEKLAAAKGIVFDLRGYPRTSPKPLQHLIDTVTQSAQWNVPVVRRPNREAVEWDTRGRWNLEPLQPRLPKNIVFLTDARAISYAESWMGIVEAHELGEIVGEPTAGTNGNINPFTLPGGYQVIFTGMKVLKHDGSQHHLIGIRPTVPVSPTLAGIRAGRDEQLEKAVEIIERKAGLRE